MDTNNPVQHGGESNNNIQLLPLEFNTRSEMLETVRIFYENKGYVVVVGSSKEKYVYLKCDRGGCYRDTRGVLPEQHQRSATSRLIDCLFQINGKQKADGSWVIKLKNNTHNHEPSTDISGQPLHRRLSSDAMKAIEHMTNSGIAPRQILSSMRQDNPTLSATARTIYNAKAKIRKDDLADQTMIQALFEELGQGDFIYNFDKDESGRLTWFFFSHPRQVTLTQNFSNVFIMDCTYKTNKYNMPLLEIIGVTCFNTSFCSCYAFIGRENEEHYTWALEIFKRVLGQVNGPFVIVTDREQALFNAIKIVFPEIPNLLCVWHIEKNILANCKQCFDTKDGWDNFLFSWNKLVYSSSEDAYESSWHDLSLAYTEKKKVVEYIRKNWLPWKKMFVSAWTENYLHFSTRVTSRAEGAHARLKKYLQVSTGNFKEVKTKLCLAVENEFNEIKVQLASEQIEVLHKCNNPAFKNLIFHVSLFALNEIYKQYEKAKRGTLHPICTGQFMATINGASMCSSDEQLRNFDVLA